MTDNKRDTDNHRQDEKCEDEREQIIGTYQRAQITDMGSTTTRSEKGVIHCLTIVGTD